MAESIGLAASIMGLLKTTHKVIEFANQIKGASGIADRSVIHKLDKDSENNHADLRAADAADDLVIILTACVTSFTKLDNIVHGMKHGKLAKLPRPLRDTRWAYKKKELDKFITEIQPFGKRR
ncbi:hypothetical protein FPQ18DRAFT_302140 [Pyronema domesticum]|nr:hypothetical protein FPQ18DRAFT_302140 [Pyronema domesticum]